MYIQYVDTRITFTIKRKREPTHPYTFTRTHIRPHVSAFVSHTYTLNSLTFSLSRTHTNHAGSKRCWGCNLSGIGLITAYGSAVISGPEQHLLLTPDLTSHLLTRETMLPNNFSGGSLPPFPWPLNPWRGLLSESLVCVCQPELGSRASVPSP